MNMINSYGPNGSVTYGADPNAPGGYSQTTTLNQGQQSLYDSLLNFQNQQVGAVGQSLAAGVDTKGLPGLSTGADLSSLKPGQGIVNSFDTGPALQYDFNQGQAIQGQVGGDLDAARQQSIDAVYGQATSRLDPSYERMSQQLSTELANQGLSQNSDAYRNRMLQFGQDRTDAYNQAAFSAVGAGEQAANALFGRQLSQGQFANAAAGQQYSQNLGAADFFNSTAGQNFGQNQDAAGFTNSAQDQAYAQQVARAQLSQTNSQISNAARNQGVQERGYLSMLPLQQMGALQQLQNGIGMPNGIGYTPSQVGQTDVLGAYGLSQQQANANYQAGMNQQNGLMSGLFGLGSAAIMASDRRLKRDVVKVGQRPDGLGVYLYRYLWSPVVHLGVMAQEVLRVKPSAVLVMPSGFLAVDYGAL